MRADCPRITGTVRRLKHHLDRKVASCSWSKSWTRRPKHSRSEWAIGSGREVSGEANWGHSRCTVGLVDRYWIQIVYVVWDCVLAKQSSLSSNKRCVLDTRRLFNMPLLSLTLRFTKYATHAHLNCCIP